jgi:ribonuclease D
VSANAQAPTRAEQPEALLVTTEEGLRSAVAELATARRIGVDLESNGLFRYRATLCTVQLVRADAGGEAGRVVIVDTLGVPLAALAPLLGPEGPQKLVHDVAFDARILAEAGIALGNVLDTSVAARMLGRTATGLASLLASELGIEVDKKLQHHDWTTRPLRPTDLAYLVTDVIYLGALADRLEAELEERGIAAEVNEETRYRILQSITAAGIVDRRPPYLRLKGIDRVPAEERAILRGLADVRETKAKDLDVPPYKVIGPDVLFAIARAKPRSMTDLEKIKGALSGQRARSLAPRMLEAVTRGVDDPTLPETETAMLVRPRLPPAVAKARRAREARLTSWRKSEAKKRGVDEQVVLPGHCLQALADLDAPASLEAIAGVPGIGIFRVARDGEALLAALGETRPESGPDE